MVTGVSTLDISVVTVTPLLTPGQTLGDLVIVGEVGSLVLTGPVTQTAGHWGAAQRRHGLEVLVIVPENAVGVDHILPELVGALDVRAAIWCWT